jgi:hypothetical protein
MRFWQPTADAPAPLRPGSGLSRGLPFRRRFFVLQVPAPPLILLLLLL